MANNLPGSENKLSLLFNRDEQMRVRQNTWLNILIIIVISFIINISYPFRIFDEYITYHTYCVLQTSAYVYTSTHVHKCSCGAPYGVDKRLQKPRARSS